MRERLGNLVKQILTDETGKNVCDQLFKHV